MANFSADEYFLDTRYIKKHLIVNELPYERVRGRAEPGKCGQSILMSTMDGKFGQC